MSINQVGSNEAGKSNKVGGSREAGLGTFLSYPKIIGVSYENN